jgi:hypothetical protein
MVALSWKWFLAMARRGKDGREFPSSIAIFAARAVRCGRKVCRQESTRDALSPVAQGRHDFAVCTLPEFSTLSNNPLEEALTDNRQTPVPDQVSAIR